MRLVKGGLGLWRLFLSRIPLTPPVHFRAEGGDPWVSPLEKRHRILIAGEVSGLSVPTSSGLSRFLLDTYDDTEVALTVESASDRKPGDEGHGRPPRYGAFVFGDRIPLNVTIDWDSLKERPELLALALKTTSEYLPAEGGKFDLDVRSSCGVYS